MNTKVIKWKTIKWKKDEILALNDYEKWYIPTKEETIQDIIKQEAAKLKGRGYEY